MWLDFSQTVNLNFFKDDNKIGFYTKNQQNSTSLTKNQQNSMNNLEGISQNIDFGPKRGKFGPNRAQNGQGSIFPDCKHQFSKRRP